MVNVPKIHDDTLSSLLDRIGIVREELVSIERSLERMKATESKKAKAHREKLGALLFPPKRSGPTICRAVRDETAQHVAGISQANRCALSGARQSTIACRET